VSALWVAIVAVTLASAAIKAAGPILVGGRELPPRGNAVIALLAPALLAALVVTETFGDDDYGHLALDERALGVGVAAVALALRAPVLLAVALAALVTALARLFG
jgi:branched-subunit amino acid transport protein